MIIDTHVHIGKVLDFDLSEEDVLYSMERYGISYSLVSNLECAENDHDGNPVPDEYLKKQCDVLRNDIRFARSHPDKIGLLAWLKIRTESPDAEFERLIEENRDVIFGFKLHPFHSRTSPDDKNLEAYYEIAQRLGLPVVSHTGGCEEADPIHLYNAAKKHPNIDFVMVHMGLGTDNRQALDLLGKLPNLYGDTTWVPISTTLEAIKRFGSGKMIFGSDNPIDGKDTYLCNRWGDRSLYQKYFNEFKGMVTPQQYDDVMYKNAVRLFGLKNFEKI